jgi:hypothetical protein
MFTLLSLGIFMVLIFVKWPFYPRAITRLEQLDKLKKKPVISSGFVLVTFQLVA